MSDDLRHILGKLGEDLACAELERRGYAISARRYRTRFGEIDIIATDGDTQVFVEVKTRQGAECGTAAEAITPWKIRRLSARAGDYLARRGTASLRCRFDVVAIDFVDGRPRVTVYPNAFDAAG